MTLFSYHSGAQALIVHDPTTGKPLGGVKITALQQLGWKIDDVSCRLGLPRVNNEIPGAGQRIQLAQAGALDALKRRR